MLPEYKKVLDKFGLKHTGDGCYSWNGHWLVSYYGDEKFSMWAVTNLFLCPFHLLFIILPKISF